MALTQEGAEAIGHHPKPSRRTHALAAAQKESTCDMRADQHEKVSDRRVAGQTQAAGFQVGARRTFPIPLTAAWELVTSPEGLDIWLGVASPLQLAAGETYTSTDGVTGAIRVVNPGVNIRLAWQPQAWPKASTVQVRTIPRGPQTVISFHHEGLPGAAEREQLRRHWQTVLDKLQALLPHTS